AAAAARGLAAFRGTGRRFEHRGTAGGVRVVDDYAHHPTEVAALLRAARTVVGDGRVVVLFQPHLFSRTAHFAAEFAAALDLADVAVVTDVYAAREDPLEGVSGATITKLSVRGEHVPDRLAAARHVARLARPGDLVLTVGAGDVTELGPVILTELEEGPRCAPRALPYRVAPRPRAPARHRLLRPPAPGPQSRHGPGPRPSDARPRRPHPRRPVLAVRPTGPPSARRAHSTRPCGRRSSCRVARPSSRR